jgi:hypothetical protein
MLYSHFSQLDWILDSVKQLDRLFLLSAGVLSVVVVSQALVKLKGLLVIAAVDLVLVLEVVYLIDVLHPRPLQDMEFYIRLYAIFHYP